MSKTRAVVTAFLASRNDVNLAPDPPMDWNILTGTKKADDIFAFHSTENAKCRSRNCSLAGTKICVRPRPQTASLPYQIDGKARFSELLVAQLRHCIGKHSEANGHPIKVFRARQQTAGVVPEGRSPIYRLWSQAIFAWLQGSPERTMAFKVTMSFRMTAVMTTLAGLPFRFSLSAKRRMTGLCRIATTAAI